MILGRSLNVFAKDSSKSQLKISFLFPFKLINSGYSVKPCFISHTTKILSFLGSKNPNFNKSGLSGIIFYYFRNFSIQIYSPNNTLYIVRAFIIGSIGSVIA